MYVLGVLSSSQVLSTGKVTEFDTPFNLLQKPQSVFRSMVERTGPLESNRLKEMANIKIRT